MLGRISLIQEAWVTSSYGWKVKSIHVLLWNRDGKDTQRKGINCWQPMVLDSVLIYSKDVYNAVVCAKDDFSVVVYSKDEFETVVCSKDDLKCVF